MRIYLFRHGEVHNPDNVLYGRLPGFHLNQAGKQAVLENAKTLPGEGIKHIYTSPLERTRETSAIIQEVLGLGSSAVTVDDRLIEVDCRNFEGKPAEDLLTQSDYRKDPENQTATERVKDAGRRILTVLHEVGTRGEDCVVVSHGDPIAGALVLITDDWDEYLVRYPDRGAYTVLDYSDQEFTIVR